MRFALLALPRSGTTWASNWLSDGGVLCHHDPLAWAAPDELFEMDDGIACTGLYLRPDLIKRLDCPVVCLWREPAEVNASLARIGMPSMPPWAVERLRAVKGNWFEYRALFDARAHRIWKILRGDGFSPERHRALVKMNVQPQYARCAPDPRLLREFVRG